MRKWSPFVVCLLDDDPSVLNGLGRLFASADLPLETFSDAEAFLGYARTHRPQVALIDICMPQMSGLEVQSRLSKISPSTRVIIFTGNDDPLVRSTALNAGASQQRAAGVRVIKMPHALGFSPLICRPLIDHENTTDSSLDLLPRVLDRIAVFGK